MSRTLLRDTRLRRVEFTGQRWNHILRHAPPRRLPMPSWRDRDSHLAHHRSLRCDSDRHSNHRAFDQLRQTWSGVATVSCAPATPEATDNLINGIATRRVGAASSSTTGSESCSASADPTGNYSPPPHPLTSDEPRNLAVAAVIGSILVPHLGPPRASLANHGGEVAGGG